MTHYAYVAVSSQLLEWSKGEVDRDAVKVGTSRNPERRAQFLRGTDPDRGGTVIPCCGCEDWAISSKLAVASEEDALDLEQRFKAAFDKFDVYGRHMPPFLRTTRGAGESDIVLLPNPPLQGLALQSLDDDVRRLYINGRSGMHRAAGTAADPVDDHDRYVDDEEHEHRRERDLHLGDEAATRSENQERAARAHAEGFYYED